VGAVVPENRLYRPDELFLAAQANLVSSLHPIFARARVKVDVQRALEFQVSVPLESALRHFEHLLRIWNSDSQPPRDSFQAALEEIYSYLGGYGKRHEAAAIRSRFEGVACLWHRGQLWLPEHVFRTKTHFFGHRRASVAVKEAVRSAYQLLGMNDKPGLADFLSYLDELADEFGTLALPADETERLLEVYRRIGDEVYEESAKEERYPLLSDTCTLVDPQDAFYANAPWFQDRIKDPRVQFLHRGLPVTVTSLPWVRSLANEVIERPTGNWNPAEDSEVKRRTIQLEKLIRSPEFRFGVARLMYHEHGVYQSSITDWLSRTRVNAVKDLASELVLNLDGEDVVVGAGPSDQYLDADNHCVYVDANAGKLIRTFVAQAVNKGIQEYCLRKGLSDYCLGNLSPLTDILDCVPGEIDQTLTRLRIRPVDDDSAFVSPNDDEEEEAASESSDEERVTRGEPEDENAALTSEGDSIDDRGAHAEASGSHDTDYTKGSVAEDPSIARPDSPQPSSTTEIAGEAASSPEESDGSSAQRPKKHSARGTRPEGAGHSPAQSVSDSQTQDGPSARSTKPDGRPDGQVVGARSEPDSAEESLTRPDGGSMGRQPSSRPRPPSGRPDSNSQMRMNRRGGKRPRGQRQRGQNRMVTYVTFGQHDESANATPSVTEEERRERIALGDAAAKLVCEFERKHGRIPTMLAHNHPGWDIDSFDVRLVESQGAAGVPSRMIEVKGIRGSWTPQGVALSRCQFATTQLHGDQFWLYVVEFAHDPAMAIVHPIPNPFVKITHYWFDNGWRQLADATEAPSATCRLTVGQRIDVVNKGQGVVEQVEERGALRVIHVRLGSGELIRKQFSPTTMRPVAE
jgi:hypothetical protein